MRYGTQFAGIVVGALGVAVLLRGPYHSGGVAMIAPGSDLAAVFRQSSSENTGRRQSRPYYPCVQFRNGSAFPSRCARSVQV